MLRLTVNKRPVETAPEPRTHLADVLREHLNLTGTHLGCEHGVCGACTVMLDGVPARSCITLALACEGAEVTTIEGLDADEIAAELRAAFTREHALQCGYCTPGMLISARDLVLRLPEPSERDIRLGLAGNLCRCTGYVGIVRAVRSVIAERRGRGIAPEPGAGRQGLGPAGSWPAAADATPSHAAGARLSASRPPVASPLSKRTGLSSGEARALEEKLDEAASAFTPTASFAQSFALAHPPEAVFAALGRLEEVAACLPGASLTGTPTPERAEGEIRIKLGPVTAVFRGLARIEREPETLSGRIVGMGRDARSRSSTHGEIRYRLLPAEGGAATRVEVTVGYRLSGALAQLGRPGLVKHLAGRLTGEFARNLEAHLGGEAPAPARTLNGAMLLSAWLRERFRSLLARLTAWR
jgi:aerobic carbon-monoxide dehydrogenase small subunit